MWNVVQQLDRTDHYLLGDVVVPTDVHWPRKLASHQVTGACQTWDNVTMVETFSVKEPSWISEFVVKAQAHSHLLQVVRLWQARPYIQIIRYPQGPHTIVLLIHK